MILKAEHETSIYVDSEGYYVIEQPDGIVYLSRSQASLVMDNIYESLQIPKWGMDEGE